jgi:hypothetical protein
MLQSALASTTHPHPHANPPPDGEGTAFKLSFPFRGKVGMVVGLKEKRSKERKLGFSPCCSLPKGPDGAFRGKVGMGVV